jgi:general stress protein 26
MNDSASKDENAHKIWDLIKNAHSALLVSTAPDGRLDSRPMGCVQTDFEGTLWFLTFAHSQKVDEIARDSQVLVSYTSPSDYEYVSLSGSARIVKDAEKLKELWSEAFRVWFPAGLDEPELTLLAVRVEEAKYWTNAASVVTYGWAYLKARLFGTSPAPGEVADTGVVKF